MSHQCKQKLYTPCVCEGSGEGVVVDVRVWTFFQKGFGLIMDRNSKIINYERLLLLQSLYYYGEPRK